MAVGEPTSIDDFKKFLQQQLDPPPRGGPAPVYVRLHTDPGYVFNNHAYYDSRGNVYFPPMPPPTPEEIEAARLGLHEILESLT